VLLSDKPRAALLCCRCSWSPVSAPALGAMGGLDWGGVDAAGVCPGRAPTGGSLCEVTGTQRGLGAFPRYCLVLTSPGHLLGTQLGGRSRGPVCKGNPGGAGSRKLAMPCSSWAKQRAPLRCPEGDEGVFKGNEMHAHT